MFAQFIHLQRFVHPIPLATHGHLDFRLPSRHDSCIRSSSLDLFPCPHRQPLLKAVSSIPFSLPLVLLIWLTFLQLWHRQSRVQGLSFFLQGQMSETQEILVPRRFFSTVASFGFDCLFHRITRSWKFWRKQMHVNTSVAYLKKNGFKGQLTLNLRKHWRVAEH